MVFAKLVKAATFGVAASTALMIGATGGMAQGKDKPAAPAAGAKAPADIWSKLCLDVPTPEPTKPGEQPKQQKPEEMKKTNVCLTQVDLRNEVAMLVGKLAVRQIAGQPKPQLLVMLPPYNMNLPAGALVKLDEKEPVKLVYTTCDPGGCFAEAPIEPAFVDQMKTGKQIAYLGMNVAGQAFSFPLPLEGFAKAHDGAPVPIEKYNEEQRKLAEFTRQRIAELRKKQEEAAGQQQGQTPAPAATPPADNKKKK